MPWSHHMPMQIPFHSGMYVNLGKQYHGFKQYSRFIRNGASILHSSQPKSTLIARSGARPERGSDCGNKRAHRL